MRLCLALMLLFSPVAMAQDDARERAMALYEEGGRLYEAGKYEEAVEAFHIAYSLSEKPLLLYNMASALERLGRWSEAADALTTYREAAPESEHGKLDSRIASLRERIASRDATESTVTTVPTPVPEPVQTAEQATTRKGVSGGAIALFATGAVGIGVGGVFTAQALGARSDWTASCVDGASGRLCPDSAELAWTRDNRSSVIADIGWLVGLGGLGGGVVLSLGADKASDIHVIAGPSQLGLGGSW